MDNLLAQRKLLARLSVKAHVLVKHVVHSWIPPELRQSCKTHLQANGCTPFPEFLLISMQPCGCYTISLTEIAHI